MGVGMRVGEVVSGWLKYIAFIIYFIFIIVTSVPPQIIRYYILEAEDP